MLETATLTPLGYQILEHWSRHRPKMVEKLQRGNQLRPGDLRSPGINWESAI
jgi:hypothetical protein